MSEPAHAWAPPAGTEGPLSPAAPMPRGFQLPVDAATMLDVTVPLAPPPPPPGANVPHLVVVPPLVDPARTPAREQLVEPSPAPDPAPSAQPAVVQDVAQDPAPHQPEAVSPDADAVVDAPPAAVADAWWAPRMALVAATLALAWQLVSFYATALLPIRVSAGLTLDNFDALVGSLPLVRTAAAPLLGSLLGLAALALVVVGLRRGVREPLLQVGVGAIAVAAATAGMLLPRLVS